MAGKPQAARVKWAGGVGQGAPDPVTPPASKAGVYDSEALTEDFSTTRELVDADWTRPYETVEESSATVRL